MTGVDVRATPQEPSAGFAVLFFMRVPEENCNMVLLATVTLFSVMVAVIAGWWQGLSVTPAEAAIKPPVYVANRTEVRVVGAPLVPNVNPRDR
jgi:hypothetical protein